MFRAIPVGNRAISENETRKRQMQHVEAVFSMKSTLDTRMPSTYGLSHMSTNRKKQVQQMARSREIDKANAKLLERLNGIMQRPRSAGSDHGPKSKVVRTSTSSVNRTAYQNKIQAENQSLLNRLQSVQPTVNLAKCAREYLVHEANVSRVSQYPNQVRFDKHRSATSRGAQSDGSSRSNTLSSKPSPTVFGATPVPSRAQSQMRAPLVAVLRDSKLDHSQLVTQHISPRS